MANLGAGGGQWRGYPRRRLVAGCRMWGRELSSRGGAEWPRRCEHHRAASASVLPLDIFGVVLRGCSATQKREVAQPELNFTLIILCNHGYRTRRPITIAVPRSANRCGSSTNIHSQCLLQKSWPKIGSDIHTCPAQRCDLYLADGGRQVQSGVQRKCGTNGCVAGEVLGATQEDRTRRASESSRQAYPKRQDARTRPYQRYDRPRNIVHGVVPVGCP